MRMTAVALLEPLRIGSDIRLGWAGGGFREVERWQVADVGFIVSLRQLSEHDQQSDTPPS